MPDRSGHLKKFKDPGKKISSRINNKIFSRPKKDSGSGHKTENSLGRKMANKYALKNRLNYRPVY